MILAVEAELLNSFTTDGGAFDILVDDTDHVPWLTADRKGGVKWGYWNRYAEYMMSVEKKPATVVKTIDDVTERILGRIEDPVRIGGWSVRGLVVGSVQSGKTANYVGLINKAIDSGYKLIVIMAGVHSTLRRQTQIRIDESVTGVDSRKKADLPQGRSFGVGSIDRNVRTIHMLTSAKSDFSRQVGESSGVQVGGDPIILVIKKNRSILRNLQEWLMAVGSRPKPGQQEDGERWIPGCPALIIDDENVTAAQNFCERRVRATGIFFNSQMLNRRMRDCINCLDRMQVYQKFCALICPGTFHLHSPTMSLDNVTNDGET
jgi:hypothetical protein